MLIVLVILMTICCFASAGLLCYAASPAMVTRVTTRVSTKTRWANSQLRQMFVDVSQRKLTLWIGLAPVAGAVVGWLSVGHWAGAVIGIAVGFVGPRLAITCMTQRRQRAFQRQLVDALMLLSSSLKAGLSMVQAIEVLVEELPPPISQEFGLVLKETKMGMSLHESLERLKIRMPSDELLMVVTAVLVARETGGDVTSVFGQLIETIRERQKFKERIKTLTVIPRMQAVIMGLLPVVFGYSSYRMSPGFFDPFFRDELGQVILFGAIGLWCVSVLLMIQFSRIRV